MKRHETLIVEISGRRPGDASARPTENVKTRYDHLIVSNDPTGYTSEWPIVKVPNDYEAWYRETVAFSTFWQAPMNRSYAIKLARERGYRYLIQLDDNIKSLDIVTQYENDGIFIKWQASKSTKGECGLFDDFCALLIEALRRSNAGMSGMQLSSCLPTDAFCVERFCYSFFALDLNRVPDTFHGSFEDDIEFRLRLAQMGTPVVQLPFIAYGKTAAGKVGDVSGCRKAYQQAGIKRGEAMVRLYGDVYSGKIGHSVTTAKTRTKQFQHRLKPFKVGVLVRDWWRMERKARALFRKWAWATSKPSARMETE